MSPLHAPGLYARDGLRVGMENLGELQAVRNLRHIAVVVTPSAYFLGILTNYRWYFLSLLLLVLTSLACDWHQRVLWPRLERLIGPLLVFLACLAASSIWALEPLATLTAIGLPLVYAVLAICVARWSQQESLWRQTSPFVVLVWAIAVAYTYVYLRFGSLKPVDEEIKAAFGAGSNAGAMHVLVALPFLLWRVRARGDLLSNLSLMLALGLLLVSGTRTAYVIAPIIVAISLGRPGVAGTARAWRLLKALAAVGVLVGVTALTPVGQLVSDRLIGAVMALADPTTFLDPQQGDYERAITYVEGWNAFLHNPLGGIGYMNLSNWLQARYGWGASSHNLLVTLFAEAGWPAALAFIFLMVCFVRACISGTRLDPRPLAAQFYWAIGIAMGAALMLSMFHQLLEFQMFYVVLGMALSAPRLPAGWRWAGRAGTPVAIQRVRRVAADFRGRLSN